MRGLGTPLEAGKIVPPRLPETAVARPALDERLDGAMRHRLTTVIADAGFGKSTALAAWAARRRSAWYTLDERDDRLPAFAPQLVAALCRVPGTLADEDVRALRAAGESAGPGPGPADAFAGALCRALDASLDRETVLVLDNAQDVVPQRVAARVIEGLCRQSPAALRVVIASRSAPPFGIDRLRGRGEVLEIDASVLAFSVDEVAELLGAAVDPSARALAPTVHRLTGGWPAAVTLAAQRLRATPPDGREAILRRLMQRESPMFGYLAAEVFAHEPRAVRDLLRRVAPLGRFTIELCRALGILAPAETIDDLVRRGLFVQPQDEWFTLHALVREFASRAWELTPDERADLFGRAAAWFSERGWHEDALRVLAQAGAHREIARIVAEHGSALVARGAAQAVIDHAGLVPADLRTPALEQGVGEAHAVRGDPDQALASFGRAAAGAERIPAALAWRMIEAHFLKGDLEAGRAILSRADPASASPSDRALLHAWAAQVHRRLGDVAAADAAARAALDEAEASGDERALAAAHNVTALVASMAADHEGSGRHLRQALAAAEHAGDLVQTIQILSSKGTMLFERSAFAESLETYERAVRLAELAGFTGMQAQARMNLGLLKWSVGRLDEAAVDYAEAIRLYRAGGSGEVSYAIVGKGDVHRERGELALARAAYQEGLALAEASGDRQALVPALYQLSKVLVDEDVAAAERMAQRAVDYGWPDQPWALNALGWIALARGDPSRALQTGRRADAEARERHDRFGLAEALSLQAMSVEDRSARRRLLEESRAIWRELGNPVQEAAVELALARLTTEARGQAAADRVERRLRQMGVRVSASGPAGLARFVAREADVPLEIHALGGFQVLRGGVPVPLGAWQSRKARDLLKILVTRRGRPTPRETLIETLWPEEESDALAGRLSVALSTVRSVLDPEHRFAPDHFVAADPSAAALRMDHVRVDVELFLANAEEAFALPPSRSAEARDLLEPAEASYAGDLLEEDPYADWAVPLREEARAAYVRVAHALADLAATRGDHDGATRYLLRVLARDAYDERAHLGLVAALEAAGRHGEARRAYRTYASRMEELGVEAAAFPRPAKPVPPRQL